MKNVQELLVIMLFWYLVFLIPCSNFNPFEWGTGAKVFYVILLILTLVADAEAKKE